MSNSFMDLKQVYFGEHMEIQWLLILSNWKVGNQINFKTQHLSSCRAELRTVVQSGAGIEKAEPAWALPS